MRVGVVIVNYRTAGMVVDCLRSLERELAEGDSFGVVVVENASGDGSLETLERAVADNGWSAWCEVVDAERNGGFAFGNNVGIRRVLEWGDPADAVLLLNPDTYVRPGAVRELVAFVEPRPTVGIAGSRLEWEDGAVQRSAFRFPTPMSEFERYSMLGPVSRLLSRWIVAPPASDADVRCGWVAGASMLVRREVIDAIGLLDDEYFLYFEETDFCLRAVRAGFETWYVPASRVVHLVGQSTGVNQGSDDNTHVVKPKPAYWYESRRRYFAKNHGRLVAMLADVGLGLGMLLNRLVRVALPRRASEASVSWSGIAKAKRAVES